MSLARLGATRRFAALDANVRVVDNDMSGRTNWLRYLGYWYMRCGRGLPARELVGDAASRLPITFRRAHAEGVAEATARSHEIGRRGMLRERKKASALLDEARSAMRVGT